MKPKKIMENLRAALIERDATIKELHAERDRTNAASADYCTKLQGNVFSLQFQIGQARESEKNSRAEISSLKGELHDALMQSARLQGYLDRAREDDIVRELGPSIEVPTNSRREPVRIEPSYSDRLRERLYDYSAPSSTAKRWFDR
jgi:hypothetical protein